MLLKENQGIFKEEYQIIQVKFGLKKESMSILEPFSKTHLRITALKKLGNYSINVITETIKIDKNCLGNFSRFNSILM